MASFGEEEQQAAREGLTWPAFLTAAFSPEGEAPILLPYQFQMEEIESFRYRCRVSSTLGWVGGWLRNGL